MNFLGNLVWLIFGGLITALGYFVSAVVMMLTIIGIPFGIQILKIGMLALWPFGSEVRETQSAGGCLYVIMNVFWILIGGIWIALTHVGFGLLLTITIVGIPWARQHFKLAGLALTPFGKEII